MFTQSERRGCITMNDWAEKGDLPQGRSERILDCGLAGDVFRVVKDKSS